MQSVGKYQEVINKITRNDLTQTEVMGELLLLMDEMIKDMIELDHRISRNARMIPNVVPLRPKLKVVKEEEDDDFVPNLEVPDKIQEKAIEALKELTEKPKPIRAKDVEKPGPQKGHKYSEKQKKAMKVRRVSKKASATMRKVMESEVLAKSKAD